MYLNTLYILIDNFIMRNRYDRHDRCAYNAAIEGFRGPKKLYSEVLIGTI